MPRTGAIGKLSAAFGQAAAAGDWERIGVLAAALGPQLTALAARGPWTPAELQALAQLRALHDQSADACSNTLAQLGARLSDMRQNKDGWIAYALASGTEPAGQQE